jgi:uncharacterized protein (DUF952 family)
MELHHVLSRDAWDAARATGQHAPDPEAFLHCCTQAQLDFVLARHFAGATNILVLTFESDEVPAELRWVKSEPDQAPFPHLYGPIPISAVRRASAPG